MSVKRIGQRRFRLNSETAVGFRTMINHFFRGAMDLVIRLHAPVLSISLASTSPLFIICRTFHMEILCSQHIPRCRITRYLLHSQRAHSPTTPPQMVILWATENLSFLCHTLLGMKLLVRRKETSADVNRGSCFRRPTLLQTEDPSY